MAGEFGSRSYFQAADYVVCGLMILASLAIGVYYGVKGGGQRTSAAYILADRSMSLVPVTLSLLATFFSSIALQGYPADVYYHGPSSIWLFFPLAAGGILAVVFYVPMFYRIGVVSAYEYLEMRFNYVVKICAVVSFLIFCVMYSGLVTYLASVAATAVTGIRQEIVVVFMTIICAIYTVIGGIKAVLWTDSLQMLLMVIAMLAIIVRVTSDLGLGNLWEIATTGSRTDFFHFNSDLTDFYNGWGFIGQVANTGVLITTQYMVQRLVVCKSEAVARASVIGYIAGSAIFLILLVFAGICLYAHYEGCDPGTLGYTTGNDQIVPYFIIDVFGDTPGVPGLLLTGLFGAALSTLSSVLNASATLVGEHFVKPYWKGLTDLTYTVALKVIVVGASAAAVGMAFLVPLMGSAVPIIFTIAGCTFGSLLALFLLGAFFPSCGSKGALSGFVIGSAVSVTLSIGCIVYQPPSENLPLSAEMCLNDTNNVYINESMTTASLWNSSDLRNVTDMDTDGGRLDIPVMFTLSRNWLSLVTFLTSMAVALLATLLTGKNDTSELDPRLVFWKIESNFVTPDLVAVLDECPRSSDFAFKELHKDTGLPEPNCVYEELLPSSAAVTSM